MITIDRELEDDPLLTRLCVSKVCELGMGCNKPYMTMIWLGHAFRLGFGSVRYSTVRCS